MFGVPLIVGASLTFLTVRLKLLSAVVIAPSDTEIIMLLFTPTSSLLGVPDNCPVLLSKFAQLGLLLILKVKLSPSISLAVGVKL